MRKKRQEAIALQQSEVAMFSVCRSSDRRQANNLLTMRSMHFQLSTQVVDYSLHVLRALTPADPRRAVA
jgi:hypothetical protein